MIYRVWLFIITSTIYLQAQSTYSGFFQNWTALPVSGESRLLFQRNQIRFNVGLKQVPFRLYASFDIKGEQVAPRYTEEIIRESYLEILYSGLEVRIGKQYVVWGNADAVFVNDVVNPLDMRYFLIQNFDDIRIGLPMVKPSIYWKGWSLEGIWILRFEPGKVAEKGSPWQSPRNDSINVGFPVHIQWEEPVLPDQKIKNSEVGLRLSGMILGTDFSIQILNSYQDQPLNSLDSVILVQEDPEVDTVFVSGEMWMSRHYRRSPWVGLNFSRPLRSLVLRGELGYYQNYWFNVSPGLLGIDGLSSISPEPHPSDYLKMMLGIDVTGPFGMRASLQYIHSEIVDFVSGLEMENRLERLATLLLSGYYLEGDGDFSLLVLVDQLNKSGMIRTSTGYRLGEKIRLDGGWDIFWGNASSRFGQYDRNDYLYFKITYSF